MRELEPVALTLTGIGDIAGELGDEQIKMKKAGRDVIHDGTAA